jgi:hypothetical protein
MINPVRPTKRHLPEGWSILEADNVRASRPTDLELIAIFRAMRLAAPAFFPPQSASSHRSPSQ